MSDMIKIARENKREKLLERKKGKRNQEGNNGESNDMLAWKKKKSILFFSLKA